MEVTGEIKEDMIKDIKEGRIKEDMEIQEVIIKGDIIIEEVEIIKEIIIKIEEGIIKIINGVTKEDKISEVDPKHGITMNTKIMIMKTINIRIRVILDISRKKVDILKDKNIDQTLDQELHLDFKVQMLQLLDKSQNKVIKIQSFM